MRRAREQAHIAAEGAQRQKPADVGLHEPGYGKQHSHVSENEGNAVGATRTEYCGEPWQGAGRVFGQ